MCSKLVRVFAISVIAVGVVTTANAQKSGPAGQRFDTGKYEYITRCTTCHGDSGKGDGPLVASLTKRPADLTKIQKDNFGVFPFERVYDVIDGREAVAAHGPRDMPVWGAEYNKIAVESSAGMGTAKEDDSFVRGRIIALIGYIYTLQAK
jgi:mono/diheme cytochrome c family protein